MNRYLTKPCTMLLLLLALLLGACSGGGGGGSEATPPESLSQANSNWDSLVWDQDNWN